MKIQKKISFSAKWKSEDNLNSDDTAHSPGDFNNTISNPDDSPSPVETNNNVSDQNDFTVDKPSETTNENQVILDMNSGSSQLY